MRTAEQRGNGQPDERSGPEEEITISAFIDGFTADLRGYVTAQRDHLLMKAAHRLALMMGKGVHRGAVIGGSAMALLFLNVALALYLGEWLGSHALGFLITGLLSMVLVGLFHLWWINGGRDRYLIARINDMNNDEDEVR
jgi:hypothetical protein